MQPPAPFWPHPASPTTATRSPAGFPARHVPPPGGPEAGGLGPGGPRPGGADDGLPANAEDEWRFAAPATAGFPTAGLPPAGATAAVTADPATRPGPREPAEPAETTETLGLEAERRIFAGRPDYSGGPVGDGGWGYSGAEAAPSPPTPAPDTRAAPQAAVPAGYLSPPGSADGWGDEDPEAAPLPADPSQDAAAFPGTPGAAAHAVADGEGERGSGGGGGGGYAGGGAEPWGRSGEVSRAPVPEARVVPGFPAIRAGGGRHRMPAALRRRPGPVTAGLLVAAATLSAGMFRSANSPASHLSAGPLAAQCPRLHSPE